MRRTLVACGAGLALFSLSLLGFPAPVLLLTSLPVLLFALHSIRRAPSAVCLNLPEPGLVAIRFRPDQPLHQGRFDPLYASGPYCALRVRDPANGNRVFGLFRDELPTDSWRRLQVALRAG